MAFQSPFEAIPIRENPKKKITDQMEYTLKYFDEEYRDGIRQIIKGIRPLLTGNMYFFGSGGGYYHLFAERKDHRWFGFHAATQDITLTPKPFNTIHKFVDAWTGDEAGEDKVIHTENFSPPKEIINKILKNKWEND